MQFKKFDDFLSYFSINEIKSNALFEDAMIHSSYIKNTHKSKDINQRCEFFGDAILGFVICEILYFMFPNDTDGSLAKKKSHLASREIGYKVAKDICLDEIVKTSETIKKEHNSVLSCLFESFICCVYVIFGIEKTKQIVDIILVQKYLQNYSDSKSTLQEICQEKFKILPIYEVISITGGDHNPVFTVQAQVKDMLTIGEGRTKKIAQKEAAVKMIEKIHQ